MPATACRAPSAITKRCRMADVAPSAYAAGVARLKAALGEIVADEWLTINDQSSGSRGGRKEYRRARSAHQLNNLRVAA
jgi:hypothetical protein